MPAAAGDPVARAPRARAPIPAGRERVPLAARHPVGLAGASRAPVRDRRARRDPSGRLRAGRGHQRPVRRQLELARAGVVPDQLPGPRGAGALPPLLRRRPQGGVPGRLRTNAEPPGSRLGARGPAGVAVPAGRVRPAAVPRRGRAVRERSPLEGPGAVSRVLPRRQRPRRRGQPSDRLDRARAALHRGWGAPAVAPRRRPRRRRPAGWRRAGDEHIHRGRRPHRVAGGRRPGRLRLRDHARRAHAALPRAAAGRHDAADRAHGAGQRAGCLGRARGRVGVSHPPALRVGRARARARGDAGVVHR